MRQLKNLKRVCDSNKSQNALDPLFASVLAKLNFRPRKSWAIAVSGGGDSVALMQLAVGWAKTNHLPLPVVLTVDHGLRPDSGRDAAWVKNRAAGVGVEGVILRWAGAKPRTGVEEHARTARYRLMGKWCLDHQAGWLLLGHTQDDQAENFLLRLGRGSGVDGLAGMQAAVVLPENDFRTVTLLRPLLDFGRTELRTYLIRRGATWLEDPMNDDRQFARTRIRKLLPVLAEAGIPVDRIAAAAEHLSRARHALEGQTLEFLERHVKFDDAVALVNGAALAEAPREIGLRVLSGLLRRVGKVHYRPRFERLERLFDAAVSEDFRAATLGGCRVVKCAKSRASFGVPTIAISAEGPRNSRRRPAEEGRPRLVKPAGGAETLP